MPIYAFNCLECHNDFETLVRSSDVPTCPSCGGAKLQQQVAKICVEIKYPAIAKSWRRQAYKEGDLTNFTKEELRTKKS